MGDTVIKEKSAQLVLTPNLIKDLAYWFTKHLSVRNIVYLRERAATEGVHPSELLDNIINTSRTLFRSPVGKRHETPDKCSCGKRLQQGELLYCRDCSEEINS